MPQKEKAQQLLAEPQMMNSGQIQKKSGFVKPLAYFG